MAYHIYKKIELVGSSPNGFEEAVKKCARACWEDGPQHALV